MGIATITAYTDSRREAVEIEKDAGAALTEAGAVIDRVEVVKLGEGDYGQWSAKVQFHGKMEEVLTGTTLEDLACEIWLKVGGYCWLHIFVAEGQEEVQDKFAKAEYKDLMGE